MASASLWCGSVVIETGSLGPQMVRLGRILFLQPLQKMRDNQSTTMTTRKNEYIYRCKPCEKLHASDQFTVRITHLHAKEVWIRLCIPYGTPVSHEKRKPRRMR